MNPKINIVSKEKYERLISTSDYYFIRRTLMRLPIETKLQALEVSALKWKIMSINPSLDTSSLTKIGHSMRTCGLCVFFSENFTNTDSVACNECYKFTEFNKGIVCFKEFDDWLDYSERQASPLQLRKKAVAVYNLIIKALERQGETQC